MEIITVVSLPGRETAELKNSRLPNSVWNKCWPSDRIYSTGSGTGREAAELKIRRHNVRDRIISAEN